MFPIIFSFLLNITKIQYFLCAKVTNQGPKHFGAGGYIKEKSKDFTRENVLT